jgi:hypothetical protein
VSQFFSLFSPGGSRNSLRNFVKIFSQLWLSRQKRYESIFQGVRNTEWQVHKWRIENRIEPSIWVESSGKNRKEGADQFVLSGLFQKWRTSHFYNLPAITLIINFVQICIRTACMNGTNRRNMAQCSEKNMAQCSEKISHSVLKKYGTVFWKNDTVFWKNMAQCSEKIWHSVLKKLMMHKKLNTRSLKK